MVDVRTITNYLDIDFDSKKIPETVIEINNFLDEKQGITQPQNQGIISQDLLNVLNQPLPVIAEEKNIEKNVGISIEPYSDKSFVVRGNTTNYKEQLQKLGGRWNRNLQGGAGWIFSNKAEKDVQNLFGIKKAQTKPQILPQVPESKIYIDIVDNKVVVSGDYEEFRHSLMINGGILIPGKGYVFDKGKLGTVKTILGIKGIDRTGAVQPEFKQPARQHIPINRADNLLIQELCTQLKQGSISRSINTARKISDDSLNFFAETCIYVMKNIRNDNQILLAYRFFEMILQGGEKFDFIKNKYLLSISDYFVSLQNWVKNQNLGKIDLSEKKTLPPPKKIANNSLVPLTAIPTVPTAMPTAMPAVVHRAVPTPYNSQLVQDPNFRCKPNPKYEKDCQKYPEPDENDPILIFYKSLYEEDENSPLAITWLTEYGVFEDREELLEKYIQLGREGKLIKLKK